MPVVSLFYSRMFPGWSTPRRHQRPHRVTTHPPRLPPSPRAAAAPPALANRLFSINFESTTSISTQLQSTTSESNLHISSRQNRLQPPSHDRGARDPRLPRRQTTPKRVVNSFTGCCIDDELLLPSCCIFVFSIW